jgi:PAS domain S-box-containing protein
MSEGFEQEAIELAAILDTMADGVFVLAPDHTIRRWNRAMEGITGYSHAEAVGQSCAFLRPGCDDDPTLGGMLPNCDLFAEGRVERLDTRIVGKDGREVPVIASARTLRDAEGELIGAVVTITDLAPLRELEEEVVELRHQMAGRTEFHNIVGHSPQMQEVFRLIERAAATLVTVLVHGETGTGKELVARAVHYHSDRREGPWVAVNCSALSESLLESELFGHVHGAFTGATKDYAGRFERADGGTIFLDEVGDLPAAVQVKLLRVLQEREFERVGDSTPRPVDVRVLAATHRDLRRLVQEGTFREDLYYRLKVFPIHLPPLRERKEDIASLVARFIQEFNDTMHKAVTGFTPDAMRIIMDYSWPGNVRELRHAVEHAFVTSPGGELTPFDLPVELRRVDLQRESTLVERGDAAWPISTRLGVAPTGNRHAVERNELVYVLEACGWNKAEAARRLGMSRVSMWRKMKALDIPLEPPPDEPESEAELPAVAPADAKAPPAARRPDPIDLSWD